MKARTIEKILRRKFDAFTATITDQFVKALVMKNSLITGGSIASMLLDEQVNDYDVYFTDAPTALAVARYYATIFSTTPPEVTLDEAGRVFFKADRIGGNPALRMDDPNPEDSGAQEAIDAAANDGTYRPLFISPNAITLSDGVQIIIRFYGSPDEIHSNYDFVHCTNCWESSTGKLTLRAAALEALLTKELRYVGSKYPLCSIIRTRKFIKRGWSINAGQYLKMALQLNELDLLDISTLQDQLIGVDSAHFRMLLSQIAESDPEKVNTGYIIEIIDRLF